MAEPPLSVSFDKGKIREDRVVCRFYARGDCFKGDKCWLPHQNDGGRIPDTICRYYLKNKCAFGTKCGYDHVYFFERDGVKFIQRIHSQPDARRFQRAKKKHVNDTSAFASVLNPERENDAGRDANAGLGTQHLRRSTTARGPSTIHFSDANPNFKILMTKSEKIGAGGNKLNEHNHFREMFDCFSRDMNRGLNFPLRSAAACPNINGRLHQALDFESKCFRQRYEKSDESEASSTTNDITCYDSLNPLSSRGDAPVPYIKNQMEESCNNSSGIKDNQCKVTNSYKFQLIASGQESIATEYSARGMEKTVHSLLGEQSRYNLGSCQTAGECLIKEHEINHHRDITPFCFASEYIKAEKMRSSRGNVGAKIPANSETAKPPSLKEFLEQNQQKPCVLKFDKNSEVYDEMFPSLNTNIRNQMDESYNNFSGIIDNSYRVANSYKFQLIASGQQSIATEYSAGENEIPVHSQLEEQSRRNLGSCQTANEFLMRKQEIYHHRDITPFCFAPEYIEAEKMRSSRGIVGAKIPANSETAEQPSLNGFPEQNQQTRCVLKFDKSSEVYDEMFPSLNANIGRTQNCESGQLRKKSKKPKGRFSEKSHAEDALNVESSLFGIRSDISLSQVREIFRQIFGS